MPINTIEVPKRINIDGVGEVTAGINFTGGLSLSANRAAGIQLFIKSGLQSIGLYNDPLKLFIVSYICYSSILYFCVDIFLPLHFS